jgi:hypothetical protein
MGLQEDLHLTGNQPNVALAIFFIPYVVFEIPSNILLKRLTPRVWRECWSKCCAFRMMANEVSVGMHGGVRRCNGSPRLRYLCDG